MLRVQSYLNAMTAMISIVIAIILLESNNLYMKCSIQPFIKAFRILLYLL